MNPLPIVDTVEEALKAVNESSRDSLGYLLQTFRIRIKPKSSKTDVFVAKLVESGWHLNANPIVVKSEPPQDSYAILTMVHAQPRPLQFHARLDSQLHGELHGEVRTNR